MQSDKTSEYIGYLIGVLAILISLFEKNVRGWIVKSFHKTTYFLLYLTGFLVFRLTLAFVFLYSTLFTLQYLGYIQPELSFTFSIFVVAIFVSLLFVFFPYANTTNATKKTLSKLENEFQIISKSNIIELENIQSKWDGFIETLSKPAGYEIVAAYLKMSKPVRLENDTLVLGLPEVILKAAQKVELERVIPLLNSYFGKKYKIKIIPLE